MEKSFSVKRLEDYIGWIKNSPINFSESAKEELLSYLEEAKQDRIELEKLDTRIKYTKERIVIKVQGGLVQDVYSTMQNAEVVIVDEDCDPVTYPDAIQWEGVDVPKYHIY
jgi:hypothetical protein